MAKEVIIALDFDDLETSIRFLKNFNKPVYVKIGMEIFYSEGPTIVKVIKALGHKVFLDLKIHDIPNTARGALQSLAKLDIDMVNVHCAGGVNMMKQARDVFAKKDTLVIGVTQLTSTSQAMMNDELLIKHSINRAVLHYANNAKLAGLDGVVCSPLEAPYIHADLGDNFLTVCPGIRYTTGSDDQVRVTSPSKARALTCDYIVVGRPITQSDYPYAKYEEICKDFLEEKND